MSLHDWSPIATHAFANGRAAFWFTDGVPAARQTFIVTCDDGHHTALYWTGTDWSGSQDDAHEYTDHNAADHDLTAARDTIHDSRREFVAVEEF